jgi:hypothetical protein
VRRSDGVFRASRCLDWSRTLKVPRDRLPAEFMEFVEELALGWWVDREYPEGGRR